jgi:hypothetical protein
LVADQLRDRIEDDPELNRLPSHADIVREFGDSGPRDDRPLPDRVADVITSDGLRVGDPFPSAVVLCGRFKVSRPTMRNALDRLEARGLVSESSQGRVRIVLALPGQEGQAK